MAITFDYPSKDGISMTPRMGNVVRVFTSAGKSSIKDNRKPTTVLVVEIDGEPRSFHYNKMGNVAIIVTP